MVTLGEHDRPMGHGPGSIEAQNIPKKIHILSHVWCVRPCVKCVPPPAISGLCRVSEPGFSKLELFSVFVSELPIVFLKNRFPVHALYCFDFVFTNALLIFSGS